MWWIGILGSEIEFDLFTSTFVHNKDFEGTKNDNLTDKIATLREIIENILPKSSIDNIDTRFEKKLISLITADKEQAEYLINWRI